MKKILTLFICIVSVLSLTLCLSVSAFASAEEVEKPIFNENGESEKVDTGADLTKENPFMEIYEAVIDNADKILCTLTFISSIVLMFFYKKGLFPAITKGLTAIKSFAGGFEETLNDGALKTEESLKFLLDRFASFENTVTEVSSSMERLEQRLSISDNGKNSREELKTVMLSQIDLLYEIFMQSSLPQYAKDSVGEKVSEMKRNLLSGDVND